MTRASVGLLDKGVVIALAEVRARNLPEIPVISAVTLAELSVAPAVARLEIEHDRLASTIRDVRLQVGQMSGDPEGVPVAIGATRELVRRLRQHRSDAEDVVHEAYRVDIGGE